MWSHLHIVSLQLSSVHEYPTSHTSNALTPPQGHNPKSCKICLYIQLKVWDLSEMDVLPDGSVNYKLKDNAICTTTNTHIQ